MDKLELKVKSRNVVGKKVADLRTAGFIPAVIYGPEQESVNIMVENTIFKKIFDKVGNSSIIELNIDDGKDKANVLIQDVKYHSLTNSATHIDFYRFKEGQKIDATIQINFVGEPRTVKELGAILLKNKDEVEVRCLPKDLISEISVDLSKIQKIDDAIKIKDLDIPKEIQVLHDPEESVALTSIQREEKAIEAKMETETPAAEAGKTEEKKEESKKEKNKK